VGEAIRVVVEGSHVAGLTVGLDASAASFE
jgi:hypothetical protein